MAAADFAIVVGISHYPFLRPLRAPVRDATAFMEWAMSPKGGDVPAENIYPILSSSSRPPSGGFDARPNEADVENAFARLASSAESNSRRGHGLRVGRRLYIYMTGNAFRPVLDQPALLMADATPKFLTRHILGKAYAKWFLNAGYFDEVLFFMDGSSGELLYRVPLNLPPFLDVASPASPSTRRLFSAVSLTNAPERVTPDGAASGAFTETLLRGLAGEAASPDGRITANALAQYLVTSMRASMRTDAGTETNLTPEIEVLPAFDPDFVIVKLSPDAVPSVSVRITLESPAPGKDIKILNHQFEVIASIPPTKSAERQVRLPPGLYVAQIDKLDRKQIFEVSAAGGVDVRL